MKVVLLSDKKSILRNFNATSSYNTDKSIKITRMNLNRNDPQKFLTGFLRMSGVRGNALWEFNESPVLL